MKTFAMIEEVGGQHETVSGFEAMLLLSSIRLFRHSTNKSSVKTQRAGCTQLPAQVAGSILTLLWQSDIKPRD